MLQKNISNLLILIGAVGMILTAYLHYSLGLPPIIAATQEGFIQAGKGVHPDELKGIWVAFSFLLAIQGITVLILLWQSYLNLLLMIVIASGSLLSGLTMMYFIQGTHISFKLLLIPSALVIVGSLLIQKKQN